MASGRFASVQHDRHSLDAAIVGLPGAIVGILF
jgi:hypothetical protein